jgi:hypothetical protein
VPLFLFLVLELGACRAGSWGGKVVKRNISYMSWTFEANLDTLGWPGMQYFLDTFWSLILLGDFLLEKQVGHSHHQVLELEKLDRCWGRIKKSPGLQVTEE